MVDEAPVGEEPYSFAVDEGEAGERLDKLLAARAPATSRSTFARWIREGRVTLDGEIASAKHKPRVGQRVHVRPLPPPSSDATPQDLPLAVVYEDDHLIVVDKAPGMVVHPAPGHPDGTLVNALLHHFGALPGQDPARPGIVHRLDRGTSGVMVIARSARAREGLVRLFAAHDIERSYLAIAQGELAAPVTYATLHGRHPKHRKRFTSRGLERGKRAVTHVEPAQRLHGSTLVRCTLETGRTHQIRVHLADAAHPLLGDPLYGRAPRDPRLREAARLLGRQALHAAVLGFVHPITAVRLRFEREPPEDFARACEALEPAA